MKKPSKPAVEQGGSKTSQAPLPDLEQQGHAQALALRCQEVFQTLTGSPEQQRAGDKRRLAVIQALLEGTGFKVAGIARFSKDRTGIDLSLQGKSDVLQGTTSLDVSDVACARPILDGVPVNYTGNAEDDFEEDALLRELRVASFFAEPLGASDDCIEGFLFVGHDKPVRHCGLALRTFLSGLAAWLLDPVAFTAPGGQVPYDDDLDQHAELLAGALQSIDRGVIVFDGENTIRGFNEKTFGLLDAPPEVIRIGATANDLIEYFSARGDYGPEEAAEQKSRMRSLMASKKPHSYERQLPDGRIIGCKGQPYKGGMVVTYTDVSDFRARERLRLDNEKLLMETLQHMEQGLVVFDKDMIILAMNPQISRILDLPEDIIRVGGNIMTFVEFCARRGDFGPGDTRELVEAWRGRIGRNMPYSVERQTPGGRLVMASVCPRVHGGHILTIMDVTEWRRDQRELDTKTELLSVAMDHMGQGLIAYDANMVIEAFNERARSLLGMPDHVLQIGGSMVTLTETWIAQSSPDGEIAKDRLRDAELKLAGKDPFEFEIDSLSGTTILCTGRMRDTGGYVVTFTDITESKEQKRQLSERNAQFEAILEHMAQGLFAYDKDLKLLFANERAKVMIGAPREMMEPGKPFEDVVRHCAGQGVYALAEEQLGITIEEILGKARGSDPFSFERPCADGSVVLMRSHPRPQGGHIVTYTDITESKQQQTALAEVTAELRSKGEQLDTVFTNMTSGIAMFDADANLVICNPKYQEMFGLPDSLAQEGTPLIEICRHCVDSGDMAFSDVYLEERVAVSRSRERRSFNIHMKNGLIVHSVHEPLANGGSIVVFEDVTARETAEQKLRDYAADLEHQKTVLQTVMENMDQGISLTDGDMKVQAYNGRFLELLEFPTDIFYNGKPLADVFRFNAERGEYGPGDPDEQVRERMDLAAKFEAHCFVRERPDGTALQIEGKPLADRKGFVTTYTDVTETQRHEREIKGLAERLTETNRRLDAAFNSMNQGLAMFDAEQRLVVCNTRYVEILDVPDELSAQGTPLADISRYAAVQGGWENPDDVVAKRLAVANSRERTVYQQQLSEDFILEVIHEPLESGGSLALYLDVTERERAQSSLREHAAKLEASNRELQEFAYVAAHDLQEPLRKIEAFGDRLHKKCGDRLGEDGQKYVTRMQASSRRLRTLIDALLSYSRVTTKAAPFRTVNLEKMAADVLSDIETSIEQAEATVEISALPSIECDEVQLRQLFMNLIANSLKFRKEGRPLTVRIEAEVLEHKGERLEPIQVCRLTFTDNGIGFDSKYADRIFTIFQRLHSRAEFEGTGIGLATCRKIVERHHGNIEGAGSPGEGAVFTITLPVHHHGVSWLDADKGT